MRGHRLLTLVILALSGGGKLKAQELEAKKKEDEKKKLEKERLAQEAETENRHRQNVDRRTLDEAMMMLEAERDPARDIKRTVAWALEKRRDEDWIAFVARKPQVV
jgi:hypothetical protein